MSDSSPPSHAHPPQVPLDELSRLSDGGYRRYQDYCDAGHAEVGNLNNGQRRSQGGVCFWDKPGDPTANAERVATVEAEFRRRYPESPELPGARRTAVSREYAGVRLRTRAGSVLSIGA